jgi:acetyl-CoA acyltransferase
MTRTAVIVAAVRTAVGKAPNGVFRFTRPDELAAAVIREALHRLPSLDPALIDDVIIGCAMPEAEQGLNVARIASIRAGVPISASAVTVNRFCASSLEAIAIAGRPNRRRRRRRDCGGRDGVHEPRADGRQQGLAQSGAGR